MALPARPAPIEPRDYQVTAEEGILAAFEAGHQRVTLAMPCGTGKTFVMTRVRSRATPPSRVLVFVPTVWLLVQTATSMRRAGPTARFHAVCAPRTTIEDAVALGHDVDDLSVEDATDELGTVVTTDPDLLAAALDPPLDHLVISTYASAAVIAQATRTCGLTWDLMICDEAHRTAGTRDKAWALPLDDAILPARRRLFTTATPRVITAPESPDPAPDSIQMLSMDSTVDYGPIQSVLTMREAIDAGHLSDYRVATIAVAEGSAMGLLADHPRGERLDPSAAAAQLALMRAADTNPHMRSVMVFHNRIAASRRWAAQLRSLAATTGRQVKVFHVDGSSDPSHLRAALNALATPGQDLVVVSNCRLLAEGIDIPTLDAVMFAAPRTGAPDIVQIIGRAVRPHPHGRNRRALIILPVLRRPNDHASTEDRVARTAYLAAWQVLTVLAEEDDHFFRTLLQRRLEAEGGPLADPDSHDRLRFDTGDLPANLAELFTLETMRRTTSGWLRVHHHLTRHARRGHGVHPRPNLRVPDPNTPDGYPLGQRLASLRLAVQQDRVPPRILALFDDDPLLDGWRTPPSPDGASRRTTDEWIALIQRYTQRSGTDHIQPWQTTVDPRTGKPARIGQWVARLDPNNLTTAQRDMLTALLPHHFPAPPK